MMILILCAILLSTSSAFATERFMQPVVVDNNFSVGDADIPFFSINGTTGATSIGNENSHGVDTILTVSGNSTSYIDPQNGHLSIRKSTDGSRIFDIDQTNNEVYIGNNLAIAGDATITGTATINGNIIVNTDKFIIDHETGQTTIAGDLHVDGTITTSGGIIISNANLDIQGNLTVSGTSSLDHLVIMQNQRTFGRNLLPDATTSTTQAMLHLSLPAEPYLGTVDITYMGEIYNNNTSQTIDLEVFSAKYLVSRMDITQTATVVRLGDGYCNNEGSIIIPETTGSIYASALDADYTHASLWTPDVNTVYINFIAPTSAHIHTINQTVLYEIQSGISTEPAQPIAIQ